MPLVSTVYIIVVFFLLNKLGSPFHIHFKKATRDVVASHQELTLLALLTLTALLTLLALLALLKLLTLCKHLHSGIYAHIVWASGALWS